MFLAKCNACPESESFDTAEDAEQWGFLHTAEFPFRPANLIPGVESPATGEHHEVTVTERKKRTK